MDRKIEGIELAHRALREPGSGSVAVAALDADREALAMRKILMVAFHYPPAHGSSGIHRTLNFSRYLPDHGWRPVVLTVTPGAHPGTDRSEYERIPRGVCVERAIALDAARHMAIRGAYPKFLALPDRWISWLPGALVQGLRAIRRHRPSVLWSTYPIATAHLIALWLHRLSGIPWIADFRDPMIEKDPVSGRQFPSDPLARKVNNWIERSVIKSCAAAVFTTPGTATMYAQRFSHLAERRWAVIANGYDEESFSAVRTPCAARSNMDPIVLVHSGVLYPHARDPRHFFQALAALRASGEISPTTLRIVLRGSGHEALYQAALKEYNLEDLVFLEKPIPYEAALAEMLSADGLLIFQASNCNWQIPAKIYEYLRAQRPILAFTDPEGDTARLLQAEGVGAILPIHSSAEIAEGLRRFLRTLRDGSAPRAARVEHLSRRCRTRELAGLLDSLPSRRNG